MALDLSNGNGTARRRPTLEQLLALDRERRPAAMRVHQTSGASQIGILSRTLIPSSMTKWILPARLKPRDNIQLLFVGENYIHIKEVVPDARMDYRLRHRQSIPFISSPIRAVAILGPPLFPSSQQDDTKLPSLLETMAQVDFSELERRHPDYPIQVLVLVLECGTLQLMTPDLSSESNKEYLSFKTKRIPLPITRPRALLPGARIAVDPYTRAFAVAAAFDKIVLYNNRSSELMSVTLADDQRSWDPIDSEQTIRIPGCIIGLDFLNAGPTSSEVVVVIVTATGRQNVLTCIAWDHQDFSNRRMITEQRIPPQSGSLCNMIIPLVNSPDFLLIHGDTVNIYTGMLEGRLRVHNICNKESNWDAEPCFPASSKRRPHFTSWARTSRPPGRQTEFIYLMREDGAVRYYRRHPKDTVPVGELGNSGIMDCCANTAFATFCPAEGGPDLVVAAGDLSAGEFHSVGTNQLRNYNRNKGRIEVMDFVKQGSLPDWAPIMDMHIMPAREHRRRPLIMTTSSRQPFGALSELRVGCEAHVAWTVDLSEMDEALVGANAMWVLVDARNKCMHVVCSYPNRTAAICVLEVNDIVRSPLQVDHGQETLLACVLGGDAREENAATIPIVATVTASAITLQRFEDAEPVVHKPFHTITGAASDGHSLLVISRDASQNIHAHYCEIQFETLQVECQETHFKLEHEVTALDFSRNNKTSLALITTRDGALHVSLVDLATNKSGHAVSASPPSSQWIVQSVLAVRPEQESDSVYLLSGSRNGDLTVLFLELGDVGRLESQFVMHHDKDDADSLQSSPGRQRYKIGDAPVNIVRGGDSHSRVLILCGSETLMVDLGLHHCTFTSILTTTENDTSFQAGSLAAIAALPALAFDLARGVFEDHASFDARLVCHDGQNIMFTTLLGERQVLPRRLPLKKYQSSSDVDQPLQDQSGTPTKLLYSKTLDAMVATGVKYEHRPSRKVPYAAWQGTRVTRGFLTVLPSDGNQSARTDDVAWNRHAVHIDLAPAERVLCVCEWVYENERTGGKHPFLVVGTGISNGEMRMIDGRKQRVQTGKLWMFVPSRSQTDGSIELALRAIKTFKDPVRAVAVLDKYRLVIATQGVLRIYTFRTDKHFSQELEVELPSPATYITIDDRQRIIVTTARHSVCGYEINAPDDAHESIWLEQFFTDNIERDGITHLVLDHSVPQTAPQQMSTQTVVRTNGSREAPAASRLNLLLAADRKGQVFGLDLPNTRRNQNAAPTAFELRLPQSITKFSRGITRAPWYERRSPLPGVLADDIAGATTDGTVYHFTILTNEARLLLKFLENLVHWNENEEYRLKAMLELKLQSLKRNLNGDEDSTQDMNNVEGLLAEQDIIIDPEYVPGEAGHRHRRDQYGINGDILMPLLDPFEARGQLLYNMLNREELRTTTFFDRSRSSAHVGNQVEERWRKFDELVEKVARRVDRQDANTESVPVVVHSCIVWLEEIMRPVL